MRPGRRILDRQHAFLSPAAIPRPSALTKAYLWRAREKRSFRHQTVQRLGVVSAASRTRVVPELPIIVDRHDRKGARRGHLLAVYGVR